MSDLSRLPPFFWTRFVFSLRALAAAAFWASLAATSRSSAAAARASRTLRKGSSFFRFFRGFSAGPTAAGTASASTRARLDGFVKSRDEPATSASDRCSYLKSRNTRASL